MPEAQMLLNLKTDITDGNSPPAFQAEKDDSVQKS